METEAEVVDMCGAFLQYYRETGIYGERTAPWLARMGFDNVKTVLLDENKRKDLWETLRFAMEAKGQKDTWGEVVKSPDLREKMYTLDNRESLVTGGRI